MTKSEFLDELKNQIAIYPSEETDKSIEYYSEMIDDRMEDGMTEAEAIASLGKIEAIAQQIKEELPITTLMKQKTKEKTKNGKLPVWAIILLILGFPLWGGVLLAVIGMILSIYILIWSMDLFLWTMVLGFGACGLAGVAGFIGSCIYGSAGSALFYLGTALVGGGLGIFLFFGSLFLAKGICHGTGWCFRQMKKVLIG